MSYEIQSYNAQVICMHICVYILRESISYWDRFGLARETKYFWYQLISVYRFRIIAIYIFLYTQYIIYIYIYLYMFIYVSMDLFIFMFINKKFKILTFKKKLLYHQNGNINWSTWNLSSTNGTIWYFSSTFYRSIGTDFMVDMVYFFDTNQYNIDFTFLHLFTP